MVTVLDKTPPSLPAPNGTKTVAERGECFPQRIYPVPKEKENAKQKILTTMNFQ